MTFGLTDEGFAPKDEATILADLATAERAGIAADLDTSAESLVGQINAAVAPALAELWELGALAYAARDPGGATLAALDALCAITGTTRRAATAGLVTLRLTVAASTTVPTGVVAQVAGQPTNRWVTLEDAVNATGAPATVDVRAAAQTTGRIVANAGTITVIATPATGWTAVTNPLDAAAGSDVETDAQLRLRRAAELSGADTATLPAIRRDVLELADAAGVPVLATALVAENPSSYTDALGRPPHAIEVVAQFRAGLTGDPLAAARQQLAAQIFASKAGGIDTYGQHTATVLDANGDPHTMRWTEPTAVPIYATALLAVDPGAYAGDAAVKDALVAYGATLRMGDDVRRARLECVALDVAGVLDVGALTLGLSSTVQAAANVAIGPRELATLDTSRIVVTTVVAGS